jgi:hypothetical protein
MTAATTTQAKEELSWAMGSEDSSSASSAGDGNDLPGRSKILVHPLRRR